MTESSQSPVESGCLPAAKDERLDLLFRQAEEIWSQRPDLQEAYGDIRSSQFWYWLMWHGTQEDACIRDNVYPLPDAHLSARVVGETSARSYLESGIVDWRRAHGCLVEAGFDFDSPGHRVLDFGVGCGRILQIFARYAPTCTLHGADVDAEAIAWCRQHLTFGEFSVLSEAPPSELEDQSFDAVYSFSVFSHLPEAAGRRWLEELHRLTRPGAILVITIQGRKVVEEFLSGNRPDDFPPVATLEAGLDEFEDRGVAFFPYVQLDCENPENRDFFAKWDLTQYGSTFILESYVRRHWLDLFELVAFHRAPDEWQDYVVLRRRG